MSDFDAWTARELNELYAAVAAKHVASIRLLTREEWEAKGAKGASAQD